MITVNGKNVELPHPMSVAEYLETNQYSAGRIAVELNHKILAVQSAFCRYHAHRMRHIRKL